MLNNRFCLSFRGAAGDEESRKSITCKERFLAALGMTASEIIFQQPARCREVEMPIGCLTLEIHLTESRSLKDKRQVLRSLKDRLRHRFNVSVAELDGQDTWQRAVVGIVAIAADTGYLEKALQAALEESELILGRGLIGHETELF